MQLNGTGIVQIAPWCHLRTNGLKLPSPCSKGHVCQQKPPEGTSTEDDRYKENDETLTELEDQLNEISSQEQRRAKQTILTHGFYVELGLLSIGLVTYLCHVKLIAVVRDWKVCLPRGGKAKTESANQANDKQAARQATDICPEKIGVKRRHIASATNAPAPKKQPMQKKNKRWF